jgi:hypothetical protein
LRSIEWKMDAKKEKIRTLNREGCGTPFEVRCRLRVSLLRSQEI